MHVIKADSKLVTVSYFNETQRCSNISSNFYFGTLFKTSCVDFLGSKNIANSHEKKELIFFSMKMPERQKVLIFFCLFFPFIEKA